MSTPFPNAPPPVVRRDVVVRGEDLERHVRALQRWVTSTGRFWKPVLFLAVGLVVLIPAGAVVIGLVEDADPGAIAVPVLAGLPLVPVLVAVSVLVDRWRWGRLFRRHLVLHAPPGTSVGIEVGLEDVSLRTRDAVHRIRVDAITRATWVDALLVLETRTELFYAVSADLIGPDGWALLGARLRCPVTVRP